METFPIQPAVCVAGWVPGGLCGEQVLDLRDGQRSHARAGRWRLIGREGRRRSNAAVTVQIANAAMTSAVWRAGPCPAA